MEAKDRRRTVSMGRGGARVLDGRAATTLSELNGSHASMRVALLGQATIHVIASGHADERAVETFEQGTARALEKLAGAPFVVFVDSEHLVSHTSASRRMLSDWGLRAHRQWRRGFLLPSTTPLVRMATSAAAVSLSTAGLRLVTVAGREAFEAELARHVLGE